MFFFGHSYRLLHRASNQSIDSEEYAELREMLSTLQQSTNDRLTLHQSESHRWLERINKFFNQQREIHQNDLAAVDQKWIRIVRDRDLEIASLDAELDDLSAQLEHRCGADDELIAHSELLKSKSAELSDLQSKFKVLESENHGQCHLLSEFILTLSVKTCQLVSQLRNINSLRPTSSAHL